jgi:spermidine synthase
VVGLVARRDDRRFDLPQIRARFASAAVARSSAELSIDDDLALLGTFIADSHALERFAGDAPINTDDRPVVAYRAPRLVYAADSLPRDRLLDLLGQLDIAPGEVIEAADSGWTARLSAYWSARDRFIEVGRDVEPTTDVEQMLAQVREGLLGVLRISPDFRPAADPLLRMAAALNERDPAAARALLAEVTRAQRLVTTSQ